MSTHELSNFIGEKSLPKEWRMNKKLLINLDETQSIDINDTEKMIKLVDMPYLLFVYDIEIIRNLYNKYMSRIDKILSGSKIEDVKRETARCTYVYEIINISEKNHI